MGALGRGAASTRPVGLTGLSKVPLLWGTIVMTISGALVNACDTYVWGDWFKVFRAMFN